MNTRLLITETQLKEQSPISANVDPKVLISQMYYTQEKYIRPLLGDDLYYELLNQYTGNTLSSNNSILYHQYVQPCLVNYTVAEVLPLINFRVNNMGVNYRQDQSIVPAEEKTVYSLASKYRNQGEWYGERTTQYLLAHPNDYPLYLNGNTQFDKIRPSTQNYNNSVYVGPSVGKRLVRGKYGFDKPE